MMKKPSTAHLRLANRLAITAPCRTGGALELVSPCHRTPTRPRGKLLCAELLRHLLTTAELAALPKAAILYHGCRLPAFRIHQEQLDRACAPWSSTILSGPLPGSARISLLGVFLRHDPPGGARQGATVVGILCAPRPSSHTCGEGAGAFWIGMGDSRMGRKMSGWGLRKGKERVHTT
jgi:hypothetical protein